ncbi:AAA family ATPase [Veillonella intestinalis]|uniref:AAA family ATPase n=1 Tax=Veillonella intestinalis TaxID=2941341 RepID=UPI002040FCBF|nr:AAA family ATPase [Veillonella intestinalis]
MINVFWGPTEGFKDILPKNIRYKSLSKLIQELDEKNKEYRFVTDKMKPEVRKKRSINNLVVFSEEYSRLSDSGLYGFLSIIKEVKIKNLYFQNPPEIILNQLNSFYQKINIKVYEYKKITANNIDVFNQSFEKTILGQTNVKNKLMTSFYKLSEGYNKEKPLVMLFYGPSGVGKTETAKFISNLVGEKLFRRQFSMYQNESFSNYVFGSKHTSSSLAQDLLNRESNVILFDEFDKANNIFYSAFYEMFDEGSFSDKNYKVNLKNSIIICTSNFLDLAEIRNAVGDAIYNRFDAFIEYRNLSEIYVKELIGKKFIELFARLGEMDKQLLNYKECLDVLLKNANRLRNSREIERVVNDFVFTKLVSEKYK